MGKGTDRMISWYTWTPFRIVALYALLGSLWILFSDMAVEAIASTPGALSRLQTCKGWFYVFFTALLLFALISRMLVCRKQIEDRLLITEKQLQQAQKMEAIRSLAGGIAHDFNNILASMIGYTEMTQDRLSKQDPGYTYLSEVLSAGFRARDLVKRILTFSRETEQKQIPLVLEEVVDEALSLLRSTLPADIGIQSKTVPSGMILGDITQLHQVILNLCTNACQAMKERGGVIKVEVGPALIPPETTGEHTDPEPGKYVRLSVKDTGCGIPPGVLERIFDPYFTTRTNGEGTGLGLSVTHGIVKSHGGWITARSTPGKGSSFHVYLPEFDTAGMNEQKTMPPESVG